MDTAHEKLKDFIWTNKKEIPGNGIDDDHNGYVDDVHGWCFTANKNNEIQEKQSSDELRVYMTWKAAFENTDTTKLKGVEKAQYDIYVKAKKKIKEKQLIYKLAALLPIDTSKLTLDSARFVSYFDTLSIKYGNKPMSQVPFAMLAYADTYDSALNQLLSIVIKKDGTWEETVKDFIRDNKTIPGNVQDFASYVAADEYKYADTTSNFRQVIGDDPNNFKDLYYGTPAIDLKQIGERHATLIAGIICANRINNIGIKGIADNVLLMPIITAAAPHAGSIDKDVFAAIHYAVDNGANIINMSIYGSVFEHIKEVREAFDYADAHHVLIVTAAGNSGQNLDKEPYLFGQGSDGKNHETCICTGATTTLLNDSLVSNFSNFGKETVDLFAPGTAIYSTVPGNKYQYGNGTSFACPIVVGVAALLKSYFPTLTAKQIKEILMQSVYKPDVMVVPPTRAGFTNKVLFSSLSKSGGIVNAYNAVKLADEMTKDKK